MRLKGKIGEIPTRSRHCDGELSANIHCFNFEMGRRIESDDPKSGDLPVVCTATYAS
jgi:hypothetical protein